MALAPFLARLLGNSRSSVPHSLPPVLCGSGTGPGLSRARSLRHSLLTSWSLVLGTGFCVRSPAHTSSPWVVAVGGSCMSPRFKMLSALFPRNIRLHFFRISRSFLGNVLVPSLPQLLASSCPGSYERVGGNAGLCLYPEVGYPKSPP